eukprot:gene7983-9821_t
MTLNKQLYKHEKKKYYKTFGQADLLFLPNDNGFKYVLVVVDLGNRITDAEPLKDKSSETVKNAFIDIYKRGILKMPKLLQVDPGSEFKGVTRKYFEDNDVRIRYGLAGRHRQQGLVETRNKTIGASLFKRMTAEELLTGNTSSSWTEDLPVIIRAMNKRYRKKKAKEFSKHPVCEGDSCQVLNEGTKVRVKLDEPIDMVNEKRLYGKFRAADIRWNPQVREIKQLVIIPGEDTDTIPYTKNQLQVVSKKEQLPDPRVVRGKPKEFIMESIVGKDIIDGLVHYLVKWKGYRSSENTWEPRKHLILDIPDIVKQYELNLKKK